MRLRLGFQIDMAVTFTPNHDPAIGITSQCSGLTGPSQRFDGLALTKIDLSNEPSFGLNRDRFILSVFIVIERHDALEFNRGGNGRLGV